MIDLLLLFVPFFALVLMGWGAARSGLLALNGIGALNTFVQEAGQACAAIQPLCVEPGLARPVQWALPAVTGPTPSTPDAPPADFPFNRQETT